MGSLKVADKKIRKAAKTKVALKTWDAVARYKAKHLKPVGRGPKGQPIYAYDEVAALDIQYPDQDA